MEQLGDSVHCHGDEEQDGNLKNGFTYHFHFIHVDSSSFLSVVGNENITPFVFMSKMNILNE
ncbi:hypothetical protein D3C76_1787560 [compost metagenome]